MSAHSAVPGEVSQALLQEFRAAVNVDDQPTKMRGDNVLAALGAIVVVGIFGTCLYCVVRYLN